MNKVNTKADLVSPDAIALAGSVLLAQLVESLCMKGKVSKFESPFDRGLDIWNESHVGYTTNKSGLHYFAEGVRLVDDERIVHIYKFNCNGFLQVQVTVNGSSSLQLLLSIIEGLL